MRKLLALSLLIFALALSCPAQTTPDTQATPTSFSIAAGVGFSRTSNPQTTGWGSFDYCVGTICPYTTWTNITGKEATIVAGVKKTLATQGALTLFVLGDIGAATIANTNVTDGTTAMGSNLGAVFAGGGGVDFDLSTLSRRLAHTYATVSVQAQKVSIDTLHPVFAFGVRYKFGQ
jgi:hypothetical protein